MAMVQCDASASGASAAALQCWEDLRLGGAAEGTRSYDVWTILGAANDIFESTPGDAGSRHQWAGCEPRLEATTPFDHDHTGNDGSN